MEYFKVVELYLTGADWPEVHSKTINALIQKGWSVTGQDTIIRVGGLQSSSETRSIVYFLQGRIPIPN